jgi:hypothetical protein
VVFAVGTVLLLAGLGMLVMDAQGRLDAVERSIEFTADEAELSGEDANGLLTYLRSSSFMQSLTTGADVPTYTIHSMDDEGGFSIEEDHQRVIYSMTPTWHLVPTTLPAFAGLSLMLGSLFIGAASWRRRALERSRN